MIDPVTQAHRLIERIYSSLLIPGYECQLCDAPKDTPTYRTEPIPDAEPGGQPRNPEADVTDEISRLVDWQLEKGKGW